MYNQATFVNEAGKIVIVKKKGKRPSIKDIASEAGVNISTVSHVLNKSKFVMDVTKKRVLDAVEKLGYRPNMVARSLRTKKSRAVGVIVPDIANPFFAQVIRGMEEVTRQRKYTLILACSFYNPRVERDQIDILMDHFIDGLIFFCGYDSPENVDFTQKNHFPVVVVDRYAENIETPWINVDNMLGTELAVDYLVRRGHREIGFVTFSHENQTTVRHRYEGFMRGLANNGIPCNPEYVIIENSGRLKELTESLSILKERFSSRKPPTAFVTMADIFAFALIRAFKDMGFRLPGDISVIGFGNDDMCDYVDPPLTSVFMPTDIMGKTAMELLIDQIEGREIERKQILLPLRIVERQSVVDRR